MADYTELGRGFSGNYDDESLEGPSGHRSGVTTGKKGGLLNDFVSNLNASGGVAQPNRYRVQFGGVGPNAALQKAGVSIRSLENLTMMCESIQMPGQNVRSVEDPMRFGPVREQAQGVTYGSVNARFICSSDLREKVFFEEWQGMIFNDKSWEVRFYKEYEGDILITQLNRKEMPTYKIKLYEAFPKIITQQELGWNMNDNYQTLSVELMFHNWKRESIGN